MLPNSFFFLNFDTPAFERLIRREFPPNALLPLIEEIFSNWDEGDEIHHLRGDDAQTFIDVIYEACSALASYHDI